MVIPKSNQELTFMKKAGIIVALAHRAAQDCGTEAYYGTFLL